MRDKNWLRQKYIRERLSCPAIARIVGCDPSTVRHWLRAVGIKLRPRGTDPASKMGWVNLEASHAEGHKLSEETKQKIRAARIRDGRLPCMINGKHWLHVYGKSRHPRWKGGITPERQKFQASREWQAVARKVWKRDGRTCRKCGKVHDKDTPFDIHHIVSFECRELRCDLDNLVLLCEPCHYWVHGPKNTEKQFIKPLPKKQERRRPGARKKSGHH